MLRGAVAARRARSAAPAAAPGAPAAWEFRRDRASAGTAPFCAERLWAACRRRATSVDICSTN